MSKTETRFKYKVSEKEKYADNKKLAKEIMDELIPHFSNHYIDRYDELLSNYRLYNNDISQELFEKVCNPLGIDIGQYDEEVLPYNKTYQKIDVLLGEEYKRGINYTLALLNHKAIEDKDQELRDLYLQYIQEVVGKTIDIAQLQAKGASEEEIQALVQEEIQSKTPKEIESLSFLSELEILGNDILNYGIHNESVKAKKNDGLKHAFLSDREFVYVGVEKGEPKIKLLNSITVIYEKDPETRFVQDGDWAGNRTVMSVQKVLELLGDQMDPDDKKKLKSRIPGARTPEITGELKVNREYTLSNKLAKRVMNEDYLANNLGSYSDDRDFEDYSSFEDYVFVTHLEWKWLREVSFLTTINEYGKPNTEIVDSSFPMPKRKTKVEFTNKWGDPSVKWEWMDNEGYPVSIEKLWIPRIWEGTRIDNDIFVAVREKPNQIFDLDNPYSSKLGYHGLVFNSMNARSISLMDRMKPFQFLFFVVLHQIKELIPKHIGPVQNFDTSMIDPNLAGIKGEDEADLYEEALAKTLMYRQKGLNIYNSMINNMGGQAVPTNVSRPQPGSVQNMSVAQDLNNLLSLLGWIDVQIGMAAGVSPQREAQFSNNSNVTDNQQAIVQSSYITEHYFRKHNDLWKEVMESYINYAKLTWDGKNIKRQFILNDSSLRTLDIKESSFKNANFGLFVTDSGKEKEYMDDMKQLAQAFIQNDGSIEQVSYILKARTSGASPEEIHKQIVKIQREKEEKDARTAQSQLDSQEKITKMQIENREDEQLARLEEIDRKGMWELRKAEVTSFLGQKDQDVNDNNIPDQLEVEKIRLGRDKLEYDKEKDELNRNLKREEIRSREKIAKEKPKPKTGSK
jgi:hypothetical protein